MTAVGASGANPPIGGTVLLGPTVLQSPERVDPIVRPEVSGERRTDLQASNGLTPPSNFVASAGGFRSQSDLDREPLPRDPAGFFEDPATEPPVANVPVSPSNDVLGVDNVRFEPLRFDPETLREARLERIGELIDSFEQRVELLNEFLADQLPEAELPAGDSRAFVRLIGQLDQELEEIVVTVGRFVANEGDRPAAARLDPNAFSDPELNVVL